MESDFSIVRSALRFVSGESSNICRLCFNSTDDHDNSVQDLVKVKMRASEDTLTISEMLDSLGVANEPYLPQGLCNPCATSTINSYLFIKLCRSANEKWSEALESLEKCLYQPVPISNCSKTAFLPVSDNCGILTSRKSFAQNKAAVAHYLSQMTKKVNFKDSKHARNNSKSNLNKHMLKHQTRKDGKICCQQCAKRFTTKVQLQDHAERVHFPKTIECPHCSQMFGSERMVKRHKALNHEVVACKLCFKQCASRKDLRVHLDKHQMHKCMDCNKTFQNKQVRKLHSKVCGNRQRDPACYCDICGKGYRIKNSLRSHLKTDHGFGKTYDCEWCNKKFDARSKLKNHIVTHTKERNFYCEHCGGKFVTQAALTYHIRLHTGERPYTCDLCDEHFLSASRRAEHKKRKHVGPQLECLVCHAKFVTKHQLHKHSVRHSNPHSKLYVPSTTPLIVTL